MIQNATRVYFKKSYGILLLQDVGQAVLESYSRVLEGLAFNIVSWIEDVLFLHDETTKDKD